MRHLRWIVGLLISAAALYVAFRGVEWGGVRDALGKVNYALLATSVPVMVAMLVMKSHRWRLLFYPNTRLKLIPTFGALNIGYMAGTVLPLQLGEVARAYALGEFTGVHKIRALSTVAVERLLDTLVLLLLLAFLIPFVNLPRAALISAPIILAAALGIGAVLLAAAFDRPRASRWLAALAQRLPGRAHSAALRWGDALLDGLSALSNPRIVLSVFCWTVASWLTSSLAMYLMLRAFSLHVPFAAAPFLLVATTFGFFVPSSPGAVGVWDAITIRSLTTVFSVPHAPATSFALVAHAIYSLLPTVIGAAFFIGHHLSLTKIETWQHDTEPTGAVAMAPDPRPPAAP